MNVFSDNFIYKYTHIEKHSIKHVSLLHDCKIKKKLPNLGLPWWRSG